MKTLEDKLKRKQKIADDLDMISQKQIVDRKNESLPSARFKLVGGPYHDMVVRMWPPWDVLVFPSGTRYELHPPLNKRSDRWVYVHTMEETNAEQDDTDTGLSAQ